MPLSYYDCLAASLLPDSTLAFGMLLGIGWCFVRASWCVALLLFLTRSSHCVSSLLLLDDKEKNKFFFVFIFFVGFSSSSSHIYLFISNCSFSRRQTVLDKSDSLFVVCCICSSVEWNFFCVCYRSWDIIDQLKASSCFFLLNYCHKIL